MNSQPRQRVDITVFIDFICPWCWIGKRHLDRAVALLAVSHPHYDWVCRWQGVMLLPDLPAQGLPYREFYLRRLGSAAAVAQRQQQVQSAALAAGLTLNLAAIAKQPNSGAAVALLNHYNRVRPPSSAAELVEALFSAHFILQQDIGCPAQLGEIARRHGLDQLSSEAGNDVTAAELAGSISAVPTIRVNGAIDIVGAEPAHRLQEKLVAAASRAG